MRIFPGHAFVARRYEDGVDVVHLVTDLAEPPPLVQGWRAGAPLRERALGRLNVVRHLTGFVDLTTWQLRRRLCVIHSPTVLRLGSIVQLRLTTLAGVRGAGHAKPILWPSCQLPWPHANLHGD